MGHAKMKGAFQIFPAEVLAFKCPRLCHNLATVMRILSPNRL